MGTFTLTPHHITRHQVAEIEFPHHINYSPTAHTIPPLLSMNSIQPASCIGGGYVEDIQLDVNFRPSTLVINFTRTRRTAVCRLQVVVEGGKGTSTCQPL